MSEYSWSHEGLHDYMDRTKSYYKASEFMQSGLVVFSCHPISLFWETFRQLCSSNFTLNVPGAIANVFTSLIVFIIPLPKIMALQLEWKAKISLFVVFGFGLLDIGISITRLVIAAKQSDHANYGEAYLDLIGDGTWPFLEASITIFCASAGALRPLLSKSLLRFLFPIRRFRSHNEASEDKPVATSDEKEDVEMQIQGPKQPRLNKELPELPLVDDDASLISCEAVAGSLLMRSGLTSLGEHQEIDNVSGWPQKFDGNLSAKSIKHSQRGAT
ncbi:hypothetical protein E2P81_ATG07334 [Venturia nashicola]|nr:hypothetical protein E2P81_ATG07334 [Venturia nashicola]